MVKYACPPQSASGDGSFANNLVGFQLVQGGGLTNSNFEFSQGVVARVVRNYEAGVFSEPISLKDLQISNLEKSESIFNKNFRLYPNFDKTNILNFTNYGSLTKRLEDAALGIINYFPAAIETNKFYNDFTTGYTATDVEYDGDGDITKLVLNCNLFRNPFGIDYSDNATENIENLSYSVSEYRNFKEKYRSYTLVYSSQYYDVEAIIPSQSISSSTLTIWVNGNPFGLTGGTTSVDYSLILRPNDTIVNEVFNLELDNVQEFLLNRYIKPIYTASFQVPTEGNDGTIFTSYQTITWPLDGNWNLDIRTEQFTDYLTKLGNIGAEFDGSTTDLISRFYTTNAFKEFDTSDAKVDKVLKIYGRSFDEIKQYVDGIKNVNSVNYNIGNDVPSGLLTNIAQTLGWDINISPITNTDYISSLYGTTENAFPAYSTSQTIQDLNDQFFRNLILNSAWIYKSKGTRKAIDFLMEFVGVPDALLEFNENVYKADGPIDMNRFNEQFSLISSGTYIPEVPILDENNIYILKGYQYTAFTSSTSVIEVTSTREDIPVGTDGYPIKLTEDDNYFFQKGEGWFESTPQHQAPQIVNENLSVFTGQNYDIQTEIEPSTYGQKYLDVYRDFPFMNLGFSLKKQIDNRKSWSSTSDSRINNDNLFDSYYSVSDDRLSLNVKNTEIFLNPAQALVYDVWYMSQTEDYPIPLTGLSSPYPQVGGIDSTFINPKPQVKTFYEFYNRFWKNMINVRNRQFSSDGKTSGYPTLQSIFWKYITMYEDTGIENNNFNYGNMIEYINGLGDYWVRIIEQFIPASGIWNTGTKFENSIFHRQKFIYRMQRGCQIVSSTTPGAVVVGTITPPCSPKTYTINLISLSQIQGNFSDDTVVSRQYFFEFTIGTTTFNFTLPITYTQTNLFPTSDSNYLSQVQNVINSYNFTNVGFILTTQPSLTAIGQVTFKLKNVNCTYNGTIGSITFGTINEIYNT
jgi:hypothetical protein